MIGFALQTEETRISVKEVRPGEPAESAGLQVGDQIIAVNGKRIEQSGYGTVEIVGTIRSSADQPVVLTVKRGGETLDLKATPVSIDGDLRLGFSQEVTGFEMVNQRLSLLAAIKYSVNTNLRILDLTKTALAQYLWKRSASPR